MKRRFIIDDHGRREAVIISIDEYEKFIEDLHDLAIIAERRTEKTLTSSEIKDILKRYGLI